MLQIDLPLPDCCDDCFACYDNMLCLIQMEQGKRETCGVDWGSEGRKDDCRLKEV